MNQTNSPPNLLPHRLNESDATALLIKMSEKIDRMERQLQALEPVITQSPGMIGMIADTSDQLYTNAARQGIDLELRLKNGLSVLEKLTQPNTIAAVNQLIGAAPQAPGMLAMAMDSIDDLFAMAKRDGFDIEDLGRNSINALKTLIDSGMLDPKPLAILGQVAASLQESTPQRIGPMGLMKALSDPEVQLALGFFVSVAKQLGKHLNTPTNH